MKIHLVIEGKTGEACADVEIDDALIALSKGAKRTVSIHAELLPYVEAMVRDLERRGVL